MAAHWIVILAVGLLDGGGGAQADAGQVKWDFSQPSEWVVVEGRKGACKVLMARLKFRGGGWVQVHWKAVWDGGDCEYIVAYPYDVDPGSGLPVLPKEYSGTFRMAGNRLHFEQSVDATFPAALDDAVRGKLVLTLRRVD
jgi:hypothetical protein